MALNGTTMHGRAFGEWGVHQAGHVLSLLFDTPHGASLSIVYPAWLKLMKDRIPERIAQLGKKLFHAENPDETIMKLEEVLLGINCPIRLSHIQIFRNDETLILDNMMKSQVKGNHYPLTHDDYKQLIKYMFAP